MALAPQFSKQGKTFFDCFLDERFFSPDVQSHLQDKFRYFARRLDVWNTKINVATSKTQSELDNNEMVEMTRTMVDLICAVHSTVDSKRGMSQLDSMQEMLAREKKELTDPKKDITTYLDRMSSDLKMMGSDFLRNPAHLIIENDRIIALDSKNDMALDASIRGSMNRKVKKALNSRTKEMEEKLEYIIEKMDYYIEKEKEAEAAEKAKARKAKKAN